MAKRDYSGSWAKGFASTFAQAPSMMMNALEWKEKKKAQKKIDDAMEELKLNSSELARKYDMARADGTITQQEYSDTVSWAMPLGNEILSRVKELYGDYQSLTSEQINAELEDIKAFYDLSKDLDFQNIEQMRAFGSRLTQPKAKIQWDSIIKSIESRQVQPAVEVFPTAGGVTEAYPGAGVKYTEKGYVPTFQEPTTETAKTPTNIEQKIAGIDKLEKAGIITKERANESRAKIYGGVMPEETAAGEPKTRTTSLPTLENYRDKALNADTWEDAQSVIKDYTEAGYDVTQLGIDKEAWANSQKGYLNNIKKALDNLVDEKGWLKKGKFTKDQVGLEFTGERTAEEIYEILYEQYMKYFNMLTKMGLPLLEFPILKPLSKIEKVGFWEGAKTFGGVGKGQYKSIYK